MGNNTARIPAEVINDFEKDMGFFDSKCDDFFGCPVNTPKLAFLDNQATPKEPSARSRWFSNGWEYKEK